MTYLIGSLVVALALALILAGPAIVRAVLIVFGVTPRYMLRRTR